MDSLTSASRFNGPPGSANGGYTPAMASSGRIAVLARLTAELLAPVHVGERLVAVGWPLAAHGRKHQTASALLTERGELVARARAVWIELRTQE